MTIEEALSAIKNAVYGKDVRQAMHDGILQAEGGAGTVAKEAEKSAKESEKSAKEAAKSAKGSEIASKAIEGKADQAVTIARSANSKSDSTQSQLNEIVINGDSSVEAAQARVDIKNVSYATLKDRLDKEQREVNAQLAETENQMFYESLVNSKAQKPLMTIVDDDGRKELYTKIFPILQEEEVEITSALITNRIETGNVSTISITEFEEMKESGLIEFISHTHTHQNLTEVTPEQLETELRDSKAWLRNHGVSGNYLVYPFNGRSTEIRAVTRKYYKGAFSTIGQLNSVPLTTYNIARVDFESTFEQQKAWIDDAVANNRWVVFNTHSQYPSFTEQGFKDLIQYAKTVGIEIVTVSEAMKRFGNLADFGDYLRNDYGAIGADGSLHGTLNSGFAEISKTYFSENQPIRDYVLGVSGARFTVGEANTHGLPGAGFLLVYRFTSEGYSYRTFQRYQKNELLYSYWNGTGWSAWSTLNGDEITVNSDGTYIKYRSGTLICLMKTTRSITTAISPFYRSGEAGLTYPHAFIEPPNVQVTVELDDLNTFAFGVVLNSSTTRTRIRGISNNSVTDAPISVTAIGRWK